MVQQGRRLRRGVVQQGRRLGRGVVQQSRRLGRGVVQQGRRLRRGVVQQGRRLRRGVNRRSMMNREASSKEVTKPIHTSPGTTAPSCDLGLSSAFACRPPYGYLSPFEVMLSTLTQYISFTWPLTQKTMWSVMEMEQSPLHDQIWRVS